MRIKRAESLPTNSWLSELTLSLGRPEKGQAGQTDFFPFIAGSPSRQRQYLLPIVSIALTLH